MKIIRLVLSLIFLSHIFSGCSGFQEAGKVLRNEKTSTTDEFLIKKREPLTQPPDFNTIPVPKSSSKKNEDTSITKILNISEKEKKSSKISSSSTEESILKKIKK